MPGSVLCVPLPNDTIMKLFNEHFIAFLFRFLSKSFCDITGVKTFRNQWPDPLSSMQHVIYYFRKAQFSDLHDCICYLSRSGQILWYLWF